MANSSTFLNQLSSEDRTLLVSVPYRVGIWISRCDDNAKTRMDDKRELQALELAIAKMAQAHRKMPFAAAVMRDVDQYKTMWQGWEAHSNEDQVLADVVKAIALCRAKFSKKEVKQYKQTVWNIGMIVAQAFGEHIDPDNEMHVNRFMSWIGSFIFAPKLTKSPENMSDSEKTALKKLRAVLKS